jgi:hypothetical protein
VTYSETSDGTYSADSPGYVDVGNYTIYFRIDRGRNYNIYQGSATLNISISGALTATVTNYSGTYDGQPHGITVTAPDGATVTYSDASNGVFTAENPAFTDVGEYTVYFKVNKTGFNEYSSSGEIRITEANIDPVDLTVTGSDGVYNGSEHRLTVTDAKGGTVTYSETSDGTYGNISPGYVDVGTYTIYFRIDRGRNYNIYQGSATLNISISGALTATVTNYSGTYDSNPHSIIVTAPDGATVTYSADLSGQFTDQNPGYTNVGVYTVHFKVSKLNYIDYISYGTVAIAKANINDSEIRVTGTSVIYDGNLHGITVTGPAGAQVLYSSGMNGEFTASSPVFSEVGSYTIHYKVNLGDNYNEYLGSAVLTISNSDALFANVTGFNEAYDGQPHSIMVDAPFGSVVTYSLDPSGEFSFANPAFIDVGTYTVYFKVNLYGYNEFSGLGTVNIIPADISSSDITVISPNVTYNGEAFSISVTDAKNGLITYSETGIEGSYTPMNPGFTVAGNYTVYFRVDRGYNYNIYNGFGTIAIAERRFTLTATAGVGGTLAGTTSGEYVEGTPVTITAIPNSNFEFIRWDVIGITGGIDLLSATLSFPLLSETVVNAVFREIPNLSLTLSETSIKQGEAVVITPTITDRNGNIVIFNVEIIVDGIVRGTTESGRLYVISGLTAGNRIITVRFAGNEIYSPASATAIVNVAYVPAPPPPVTPTPPTPPADQGSEDDGDGDDGDDGDSGDSDVSDSDGGDSESSDGGDSDSDDSDSESSDGNDSGSDVNDGDDGSGDDSEPIRNTEILQDEWQIIIEQIEEGVSSFKISNIGSLAEVNIGDVVEAADGSPIKMSFRTYTPESTAERQIVDTQLTFYDIAELKSREEDINVFTSQRSGIARTVRTKFDKYFNNIVTAIEVAHGGEFGQTGRVAAKINAGLGLNTDELYVYVFDAETNKYKRFGIAKIDRNGYAQFNIEAGGLYILSNGPLVK